MFRINCIVMITPISLILAVDSLGRPMRLFAHMSKNKECKDLRANKKPNCINAVGIGHWAGMLVNPSV